MTSKKCLIINLKMGGRGSQANNRNAAHHQPNNGFPGKRPVPNNNNITNNNSSNHNNNSIGAGGNAFSPLLPSSVSKYDMQVVQPSPAQAQSLTQQPFYNHTQPKATAAAIYFPGLFNTQSKFNIHDLLQPSLQMQSAMVKQEQQQQQQQQEQDQEQDDCCSSDGKNKTMTDEDNRNKDHESGGDDFNDDDEEDDDDDKYDNVIDVVSVVKKEREDGSGGADEDAAGETDAEVKKLLETVNVSAVTKQLMLANAAAAAAAALHHQQPLSCGSSGGCPSVTSDSPPYHHGYSLYPNHNNHHHHHLLNHHRAESLVGKAADYSVGAGSKTTINNNNINNGYDAGSDCYTDDEHRPCTTEEEDSVDQDGRKIRVRSQIADDQLAVLKECYAANPRPKREELSRIADRIGFNVRVVQVWFQNNRARDRREGRLVHMPYSPASAAAHAATTPSLVEQPLDLSTKRSRHGKDGSTDDDECNSGRGAVCNVTLNNKCTIQFKCWTANNRDDCSSSPPASMLQPHCRKTFLGGAYPPPSPVCAAPPPPPPSSQLHHPASHSPIPAVALRHNGSLSPASEKRSWKRVSI